MGGCDLQRAFTDACEPSTSGAMTPSQQDICIELGDNTSATELDLDGSQFALGWDPGGW